MLDCPEKALGVKKRSETQDDDALAFAMLIPAKLGIGGPKKGMMLDLDSTCEITGESAITVLDSFASTPTTTTHIDVKECAEFDIAAIRAYKPHWKVRRVRRA